MGKDEDESLNQSDDEDTVSTDNNNEIAENKDDTEEGPKKNTDNLRRVIKLKSSEEQEKNETQPDKGEGPIKEVSEREVLEQKRAILQSIKDFDFQIKKNQEEITLINNKIESVLKDLDDLVSLYEIVSEQMNPFVGLSKVTKKRIDALENFTSEIDEIKERMGDLESFAEKTGTDFAEFKTIRETSIIDKDDYVNIQLEELNPEDLDTIIEKSFGELNIDKKIDFVIDDYIENLIDVNVN
jgi:flagellar protein FlaC